MFAESFLKNRVTYLSMATIFIYGLLIVIGAEFSVIDDHGLLTTLLVGKEMPLFIMPTIGRFFPLSGYEFSLISNLSVSPISFYLYNSIQMFLITYLLFKIIKDIAKEESKNLAFLSILFLIFLPGFATAWLRLFVPERGEIFFFTIFIFMYLKFQKDTKVSYLVFGLISANIALYYKEPAFLMLGSFAFFHLLFGWKDLNIKQKVFDILLMFSAFIFLLAYYFIVYINKGDSLYGTTTVNPILLFAKNGFNYALSDPLLIFILLPLVIYRVYIIFKSKKADMLYDSLLFSSAIYVLVFFKLNMFAYHYLLPAYSFGLIAVVYFLVVEKLYKKILFKILAFITLFFIVFSSLPTGFAFISHYKNVPHNFQNTLTFLTEYIEKQDKNNRVSIFLDGVNRNGGEVHHSFIKYLEYRGLTHNQFDIKTDEKDNGIGLVAIKEDSPYTVLSQNIPATIKKDDLIVITPYTLKYISLDKKEIELMKEEFDLLYHAESFLEIPQLNIKAFVKYFFLNNNDDVSIAGKNVFQLPLDFYVLRKK